jgi:hypothetical protein
MDQSLQARLDALLPTYPRRPHSPLRFSPPSPPHCLNLKVRIADRLLELSDEGDRLFTECPGMVPLPFENPKVDGSFPYIFRLWIVLGIEPDLARETVNRRKRMY